MCVCISGAYSCRSFTSTKDLPHRHCQDKTLEGAGYDKCTMAIHFAANQQKTGKIMIQSTGLLNGLY